MSYEGSWPQMPKSRAITSPSKRSPAWVQGLRRVPGDGRTNVPDMSTSAPDPCPTDGSPRRAEPGIGGGAGRRLLIEAALLTALGGQSAHGYDLRHTVAELTGGLAQVDSGSIYRLLRRMEGEGLVSSAWADGDFGPQRREYRLTESGYQSLLSWRPHLEARERAFRSVLDAVDSLAGASSL